MCQVNKMLIYLPGSRPGSNSERKPRFLAQAPRGTPKSNTLGAHSQGGSFRARFSRSGSSPTGPFN